jgi:3',5'-cyclic AMP phosphodiesterase CpdA
MTGEYRIAHIADLHISREFNRDNLRRIRQLLDAIWRRGVDHVVVTGDVSADADPRELATARRLFDAVGLLSSVRLTLVIGNHDVFGGVHRAEDILTFPGRCRQTDVSVMLRTFTESFRETYDGVVRVDDSHVYPFAKILGDQVLIGVNTVAHYSRLLNPVGSNGDVRDKQFARLERILALPEIRKRRKIVLAHHHFNKIEGEAAGALTSVWGAIERQTMKLRGKKRLIELFRRHKVDIVLHGHVHVNSTYERGGIRFANGGGSVLVPGRGPSFNLICAGPRAVTARAMEVDAGRPHVNEHSGEPPVESLVAA